MPRHTASCHCGAVKFAFDAQIDELVICNCSLCAKRHAVMANVPRDSVQILEGNGALSSYRWSTGQACQYFPCLPKSCDSRQRDRTSIAAPPASPPCGTALAHNAGLTRRSSFLSW
ncbi:GFA family protein [Paraburkholderia rhynchosiae]